MKPVFLPLFLALLATAAARAQTGSDSVPADEAGKPEIERISENEFRLGEILFRRDTRTIRFPATVNLDQDPLEYAIVHESGKIHESLLATTIRPYHLQIVLLLCGFKPGLGDLFDKFAENPDATEEPPRTVPGAKGEKRAPAPLVVSVEWQDGGETKRARLEDWILDRSKRGPMDRGHWSYTGSAIVDAEFQAEVEGSIIAIYLDELALINYPGQGNDDDSLWTPHAKVMPPLNSSVHVIIEPAPEKENPTSQ